jgi:hypothetical protein
MVPKQEQARVALRKIRKHFVEKEFEEMKNIHRSRISSNLTFCFASCFYSALTSGAKPRENN